MNQLFRLNEVVTVLSVFREIMGSPFQQSVDFVDHSSELYELPTKVKEGSAILRCNADELSGHR